MSNDVFVITEHMDGKFSDVSFEMVGKAKELASALGGQAVAVVVGGGVSSNVFASDSTIHVDDAALSNFNPEAYGKVIEALVKEKSPKVVMFGWTVTGMDIAAWLSARTDMAIVACLAGSFPVEAGQGSTAATTMASPVDLGSLKVKFVEAIKPAGGDVDITSQVKLVSIGRGIGGKENVELAEELAGRPRRNGFRFPPRGGCGLAAAHSSGGQVGFEGQAEVVSHARYLWRA
ncbi:hypothetical protein [Candidatus Villigracilis vicinus]|uniref:hypothetical protein n=1 Tax=Candidatus Villigracilis vicinus TaxID=3140679 RepID=UPI0031EE75D1